MTPEELAAVRERLEEFAAEVFAPLSRSDQRDKGQTYLRGLLLDGRRKSMQPMAERLGVDHQGLQQFVSSYTWAVEPVRARLARRAVALIAPDAWVVDDTGFPKDGTASPGVARQYCGSLGKVGNCQIGVSVDAVTDAASCPLNWRLFLSASWDDAGAATPEAAAAIRARRARAGIPAGERHRPKWALALEMLDELAGEGLRPPVAVADGGYGNNADRRLRQQRRLPRRHRRPRCPLHRAGRRRPECPPGRGDPRAQALLRTGAAIPAALPHPPGRPARARAGRRPRRHGPHHLAARLPRVADLALPGPAGPPGRAQPHRPVGHRWLAAPRLAAGRMAAGGGRAHRLLAVRPARRHRPARAGPTGQDPLARRTRLPGAENRPRPGPLRGPHLDRLAPPRHPGHRRPAVPHQPAQRPKSACAGLTLYAVLRDLQALLAPWTGTCTVCGCHVDSHPRAPT